MTLDGYPHRGQPIMLTEFGGIAFAKCPEEGVRQTWGYTVAKDNDEFARMFADLIHAVIHLPLFSGFCYTQFADTFQEANGLLCADRTPKIPIEEYCEGDAHVTHAHTWRRLMYALDLRKPDGRQLTLYSRQPIDPRINAPSPFTEPLNGSPHLRWNPLSGEWVTYAAYRQGRTFLPPPEFNPLGITIDPLHPTEVPAGDWDVAVFDNRFPSLSPSSTEPPSLIVPSAPATGQCDVVVFTKDPKASLGTLPLAHIDLLLQVWADRTQKLAQREEIAYVLPFENRGAEVGVTIHHPHGQIYAYPVVPPVPARCNMKRGCTINGKAGGCCRILLPPNAPWVCG